MTFGMGPTGNQPGSANTGLMKPFKEKVPSGYKAGTLQQFTPEQIQLFSQLFSHVGPESYLSKLAGGDQSFFNEIEAPALKQFASLQGNLASRFSGMGAGGSQQALGGRHSSGFQLGMNQAASDFAQQLQSQRQGLQRQAIMDLMGISESLLGQRPFERTLTQKEPSFLDKWLGLAGNVLGAGAQGYAQGVGMRGGF